MCCCKENNLGKVGEKSRHRSKIHPWAVKLQNHWAAVIPESIRHWGPGSHGTAAERGHSQLQMEVQFVCACTTPHSVSPLSPSLFHHVNDQNYASELAAVDLRSDLITSGVWSGRGQGLQCCCSCWSCCVDTQRFSISRAVNLHLPVEHLKNKFTSQSFKGFHRYQIILMRSTSSWSSQERGPLALPQSMELQD